MHKSESLFEALDPSNELQLNYTQHWCASTRSTGAYRRLVASTGSLLLWSVWWLLVHRDIQVTSSWTSYICKSGCWMLAWGKRADDFASITYHDFTSLTYHILRFGFKNVLNRSYLTPEWSKLGPIQVIKMRNFKTF